MESLFAFFSIRMNYYRKLFIQGYISWRLRIFARNQNRRIVKRKRRGLLKVITRQKKIKRDVAKTFEIEEAIEFLKIVINTEVDVIKAKMRLTYTHRRTLGHNF